MFQNLQGKVRISNTQALLCSLIVSAVTWPLTGAFAEIQSNPPNIVIIYTDDQGSLDLGSYGAVDILTPELDALAREGIRFTNMYAPSAVCSASRAGLLTGMLPNRVGVTANVSSTRGKPGMAGQVVTLAEHFALAGYRTGHIGKWHLGYSPETMPNAQGFEYSWGHMSGVIDPYSHFFYWEGPPAHDLWRNGHEIWEPGTRFAELARRELALFLEKGNRRPFLLYWAPKVPHYPLQPSQSSLGSFPHLSEPRRSYVASLAEFDHLFGWFRKKLAAEGLAENTLIIFQSDQGHSVEERASWGAGYAGNLRGHKASFFEAGLKVPAIFFDPTGKTGKPGERDAVASAMDWLPTLLDIVGIAGAELDKFDGRSLVAVLADMEEPSPHDSLYWQLGNDPKLAPWAVRAGDWKLLGNVYETKPPPGVLALNEADRNLFLVNLQSDPSERQNLAGSRVSKAEELLAIRERFLRSLQNSIGDLSND
jgi:arylsulfatase A